MDFYKSSNKIEKKFGFNPEDLNPQESRFHAIYFLDNETGSLLVSNRYTNSVSFLRDDLICSFLNAINLFICELKDGVEEELQEINFRDTRILYEKVGRLLAIGITKKTNLQIERGILRELVEDFYIRFKNFITNFNGAVDPAVIDYKKKLKSLNLNSLFKSKIYF